MKNIVIIGNVLDEVTYNYFINPQISELFKINDLILRQLHFFKFLRKNYSVKMVFREKTFDTTINDEDIMFLPNITDAFYKIQNIALIICNFFDFELYQDLLLTDSQFILDFGNEYGVVSYNKSNSLKYKKYVHEHTQMLMPSILNKASAVLYCHFNQRVIVLYELSKRFINNSINGKKMIYVGFGVTGKDNYNLKDSVQNCIFADMSTNDSNIEILQKALRNVNIKFDYNNNTEIYKDTIGANLYNYNSFNSLVYFPFKTIEFASYGHKIIIDDNLAKLFSYYKTLFYLCNSSNISKLTKMLGYARTTPIDVNTLQNFRDNYSWDNQLRNIITHIDFIVNKKENIKKIIVVKKIKIKENNHEEHQREQSVPT